MRLAIVKNTKHLAVAWFGIFLLACFCFPTEAREKIPTLENIEKTFAGKKPEKWGSNTLQGVVTHLPLTENAVALTLDACGYGDGYDSRFIEYLKKHDIPATLFMSGKWIEKNPKIFLNLARTPLFRIENHGTTHRPLSVSGRSAYRVKGTQSTADVFAEIEQNAQKIQQLTGRRPLFFRSGTAYYDEIAIAIAQKLQHRIAGYSVLGDAGATYSAQKVERALLNSKPGDIVILHMNRPQGGTAEGVERALPKLIQKGMRFTYLDSAVHK